ncbi:MAG: hypothetical protein LBU22_06845 [Dysgonamonadaceae bacterium]|jgi:hypothetical protein|nr:hypothetical protein [Dysgonamonadaceae bacterium]
MKTISKTLVPVLEIALKESLDDYESKNEDNSLGDLYLYHDESENALFFYDDRDNLLNKVQLPDNQSFNSATFRSLLQQPEMISLFEKDYIFKPFTISLVDKDFIVVEELFFLDDDTIKLDDVNEIWTHIEEELDGFLKDLIQ